MPVLRKKQQKIVVLSWDPGGQSWNQGLGIGRFGTFTNTSFLRTGKVGSQVQFPQSGNFSERDTGVVIFSCRGLWSDVPPSSHPPWKNDTKFKIDQTTHLMIDLTGKKSD